MTSIDPSSDTGVSDSCCFCLGTDTDIPSFGTIQDAQDMLKPCSTCSLVCHRRCLLDWLDTVPPNKLRVIHASATPADTSLLARMHQEHGGDIGIGQARTTNTTIRIDLTAQALESWFNNITSFTNNEDDTDVDAEGEGEGGSLEDEQDLEHPHDGHATPLSDHNSHGEDSFSNSRETLVYILAPCPQCKKWIMFSMKRSLLLTLHSALKSTTTKLIRYGAVFLGITSALTGIASMGYIGLTSVGIKMMDKIVPAPLLVRLLTRRTLLKSTSTYSSLSKILFGNSASYAVDNLEQALVQGLIDPLKFSRIPVLPIVMYRARSSSIFKLIFGRRDDEYPSALITELMISAYISSIGDHALVRAIYRNLKADITSGLQHGFSFTANPLRNIDFLSTNNIISMLVPLRWAYDLFYRLSFNRAYFNLTMESRPRTIANSLSEAEIDQLENLNSQLNDLTTRNRKIYNTIDKSIEANSFLNIPVISSWIKFAHKQFVYLHALRNTWLKYIKLTLTSNVKFTWACLRYDYSTPLAANGTIIKSLTTIFWPYLASKVGLLIAPLLSKNFAAFDKLHIDKKILIANIVGLVLVAIAKEIPQLYMARKKVKQMSRIVSVDSNDLGIFKSLTASLLQEGRNGSSDDDDDGGGGGDTLAEVSDVLINDLANIPGNFPQ
ncbi:hypothetical protein KGF57_001723 [Candida theae]|uniref:Uncharacterized protein n=1 Tax=Candida theae TaxID=1198502 RepID=A0AAD5FZF6_9ASCO|nr:uncharacterized protein KGF57_001723 [Candida theae]KAI5961486.1 hypothetical protein KGF57_001723 [Candida theae]